MTIDSIIYNLIVFPIEIIYQVIFKLSEDIVHNPVISIIVLSLCVNLLSMPLYSRADLLQQEVAKKQASIKHWQDRIKKSFTGDERFMMLQAYYKENNYSPIHVLRGSASLILQVPFFIAAYHFLSNLHYIQGVSCGPISDLSNADKLLYGINVLPLLMTLINILSLLFYKRTHPDTKLIQPLLLAGIFLVLLYASPSGLVLYWTCNNLISLIKNIISLITNKELSLPKHRRQRKGRSSTVDNKSINLVFFCSSCFLALSTGLRYTIPLLQRGYQDFINLVYYVDPFVFLFNGFIIAIGFCILWPSVYFYLLQYKDRRTLCMIMFSISTMSLINGILPSSITNQMSASLKVSTFLILSASDYVFTSFIALLGFSLGVFLFIKTKKIVKYAAIIMALSLAISCTYNLINLQRSYSNKYYLSSSKYAVPGTLTLSKNGNNVIIIMLDRALGSFVPYIMNENPSIRSQFSGFTDYPNTLSYGCSTIVGAPSLYGGYEYTPYEINRRNNVAMSVKFDEALKVMPLLFSQNGYNTTLFDPTYAGYQIIPDISVFDEYPNINTYVTDGSFCCDSSDYRADYEETYARQMRNFFSFGFMQTAPDAIRRLLYDDGDFNSIEYASGTIDSIEYNEFREAYYPLLHMSEMTQIEDCGNCFCMIVNYTAHNCVPCGNRSIGDTITNYNNESLVLSSTRLLAHYTSNEIAFAALGNWLDYLRQQGVYDNTRIIIVSDHGYVLGLRTLSNGVDLDHLNPILLVKDFNSNAPLCFDSEFMTNAEVPTIAFSNLISDPVNPFTGNYINSTYYDSGNNIVIGYGNRINPFDYPDNTYNDGTWFEVTEDFVNEDNWTFIDIPFV